MTMLNDPWGLFGGSADGSDILPTDNSRGPLGAMNDTPRTAPSVQANPVLGGSGGIAGLLPLLENQEQLDELGPLFRTLLALQGQGKGQGDVLGRLFSGIQL